MKNVANAQSCAMLFNPMTEDVTSLLSYEEIKDKLMIMLVSALSPELSEVMPHKKILDMDLVYRVRVTDVKEGELMLVVTNEFLSYWDISKEKLHEDAMKVALEKEPLNILKLSTMLDIMGAPIDADDEIVSCPLVYCSNSSQYYGASVLAYPGFFKRASEIMNGSFWILPSSIHEVLLLPDTGAEDPKMLAGTVAQINRGCVSPNDVLTDTIYHYDSDKSVFEIAQNWTNWFL